MTDDPSVAVMTPARSGLGTRSKKRVEETYGCADVKKGFIP